VKLICFVADNAANALAEVHQRLGPDAVIVSVRPLPLPGLARLWSKQGQIEVTAGVPDKTSAPKTDGFCPPRTIFDNSSGFVSDAEYWRSVAWLELMGLLPVHARRLQTHLYAVHGEAPDAPEEEWKMVKDALSRFWMNASPIEKGPPRTHVFVGPPGSGKTTALCKWLTLAALLEERPARVWRLDGATANTADFLTIHCEMLGVPLERFWTSDVRSQKPEAGNPTSDLRSPVSELWLVDLPGVEISDTSALTTLRNQLAALSSPRVHLVLNAAYEMSALLAQWRAFEACQPEDLIFTHLDEEPRRVKLWNFVFGTNCSLQFLGAGQKIPGEFRTASPEFLFPVKSL
jgi:flagellar biosynthesis protein FlhF